MKRSEIQVGVEYAIGRDWEYQNGSAQRARVTGFGPVRNGYGGGRVTGALVEYLNEDGSVRTTGGLTTREIREEWGPYSARWRQIRRDRIANQRARLQAQRERTQRLLDIIPALRAAGFVDEKAFVYDETVTSLLGQVVPEVFVLNEGGGRTSQVQMPLARSLAEYVKTGSKIEVHVEDLWRLLS